MLTKAGSYKRVGELACQLNSYLTALTTTVVSCVEHKAKPEKGNNKKESSTLYALLCGDSVLFPEGGGQPCDEGYIEVPGENGGEKKIEITNVQRVKDQCILYSTEFVAPGTTVKQFINVERRTDHMQHHSAQHLLSRVVENKEFLNLKTVSWSLTHPYCFIVVDIGDILADPNSPYLESINVKEKKIATSMVEKIENECNRLIAQHVEVETTIVSDGMKPEDNAPEEQEEGEDKIRSRGIPDDVDGPIRLIDIHGVDRCNCCGTHVSNLSELSAIKLLHQEVKNTTVKLFFITGARLLRHFSDMYAREKLITVTLGGVRPEDFNDILTQRSKEKVVLEKRCKKLLTELAELEGEALSAQIGSKTILVTKARADADAEYYTTVRNVLDKKGGQHVILISSWGTDTKSGQLVIHGNGNKREELEKVSAKVVELLGGGVKGGVSKMGFRGKGDISQWEKVENFDWGTL
ncbi:Threonyl and Alanyl tRNA synthetase second additional domain containing protein, putative [Angomonas deanei]|uniref:Threonyl and Alanyl tRNA synthetase second additional domain containing protein, putative n=1 Tax=Angomonas deanei TaxID=59799 RepID=A0A7G2C8N9_9TRYP|nr:Threonyl and Alanyl tRNA synthetase second additional domain containing protein, putative [Angomonas deanei]